MMLGMMMMPAWCATSLGLDVNVSGSVFHRTVREEKLSLEFFTLTHTHALTCVSRGGHSHMRCIVTAKTRVKIF